MKLKILLFAVLAFALISCKTQEISHEVNKVKLYTNVTDKTIRALAVYDENTVWFGAPNGTYGYTSNGGKKWNTDRIRQAKELDFRSIAVLDEETVLLMTAGSPAMIFRTNNGGRSWDKVFEDERDAAFFDAMKFDGPLNGIAFGDPIDGCFYILKTTDGGKTWNRIPCEVLPKFVEGEAAFASSNSNIDIIGQNIWVGTGGAASRILHSADFGQNWEVFTSPVIQGGKMTGMYSIDFYDSQTGFFVGGDYEDQANNKQNKGISTDGGKSWVLKAYGKAPGYQSCVQFFPNGKGRFLLSAGYGGLFISGNAGESWTNIQTGNYTTLRITPTGKTAWFAGKGLIGKLSFK